MATQIAAQGPATYQPPAYPAVQGENPTPPHQGPIDSRDVGHWNQHINTAINHPSEQLHEASPPGAEKWHASYCGFCSPFDQGLITCCCPCFTFGKTHHRLRWGNHMENYESSNTSVSISMCPSLEDQKRGGGKRKGEKKGESTAELEIPPSTVLPLPDSKLLRRTVHPHRHAAVRRTKQVQPQGQLLRRHLLRVLLSRL